MLQADALKQAVEKAGIPEHTLKRRFRQAAGTTLIEHLQNLRVEATKRLLESSRQSVDEISSEVGYEDPSFFRRLFNRRCGLTPGHYRRMFRPVATESQKINRV